MLFILTHVTGNEINKIIGCFKDSVAGWDDIKTNVIKHINNTICIPLKPFFIIRCFPNELKIANVVLIHKANDDMVFSNYRPLSVLPVFSKRLERLVYNRLIGFINNNKVLYEYQFGFQKGNSTHFAIMLLTDKITEALDRGEMPHWCIFRFFLKHSLR